MTKPEYVGKNTACKNCGEIFTIAELIENTAPFAVDQRQNQMPHPANTTPSSQNLTNCRDCGAAISLRASSCPHCGSPGVFTAPSADDFASQQLSYNLDNYAQSRPGNRGGFVGGTIPPTAQNLNAESGFCTDEVSTWESIKNAFNEQFPRIHEKVAALFVITVLPILLVAGIYSYSTYEYVPPKKPTKTYTNANCFSEGNKVLKALNESLLAKREEGASGVTVFYHLKTDLGWYDLRYEDQDDILKTLGGIEKCLAMSSEPKAVSLKYRGIEVR